MKLEKDNAADKADTCENQAKEANLRADKIMEEVAELTKRLTQVTEDHEKFKNTLEQANKDLEEKEKLLTSTEANVAALTRKVQQVEEDLEKSEERSGAALSKLLEATQSADENNRLGFAVVGRVFVNLTRRKFSIPVCARYWRTVPSRMRSVWTN